MRGALRTGTMDTLPALVKRDLELAKIRGEYGQPTILFARAAKAALDFLTAQDAERAEQFCATKQRAAQRRWRAPS